MPSSNGNGELKFCHVTEPTILLPILKERHPASCMLYNQVMQHKSFEDALKFYTIGPEIDSNTWIISNNIRKDYGCNYTISAPIPIAEGKASVPDNVKECISSGGGVIDWNELGGDVMFFAQMTKPVAGMIAEISANEKGNVTEIHPGILYYMEIEDALKLKISHEDPAVQVRRLDASKNEAEFIHQTWKYTLPGTDIELKKCISKIASGGIFLDGNCVCGVYVSGIGFLSALYTLKEHRKKGYANVVMNYTFREYAKDGCIPCLDVESQNTRSKQFHEKLNMKVAMINNAILVKKLDVD